MSTKKTALYGVYGAGGCGRGILPVADMMLAGRAGAGEYELVYIDDEAAGSEINGRRVVTLDEFAEAPAESRAVSLGVAQPAVRAELDRRCREHGLDFFSVIAPNAVIMCATEIGEGAVLSPFVTVTSNVKIGSHFHANIYSYVEHDCRVGDFVTFAPSVHCNGNVVIEDRAYLGAGCVVRQGTPGAPLVIGEDAVVGMGAVVTKSVPSGVTVVGNPARRLGEA